MAFMMTKEELIFLIHSLLKSIWGTESCLEGWPEFLMLY